MYVAQVAGGHWFYRSLLAAVLSLAICPSEIAGAGRTWTAAAPAVPPALGGAPLSVMARLLTQATNHAQTHPAATAQSVCLLKDAGLYPDPEDCACFFACDGLSGGLRACCTATIFWRCFNTELRWCDLCANVEECSEGSPPSSAPPPKPVPRGTPLAGCGACSSAAPPVAVPAVPPSPSVGTPSPPVTAPETPAGLGAPSCSPTPSRPSPPVTAQTPPTLSAPPPSSGIGSLRTLTYWGQPGVAVNGSDDHSLAKACQDFDMVVLQSLPLSVTKQGGLTNLAIGTKCSSSANAVTAARCASTELSVAVSECQKQGRLILLGLSQNDSTLFSSEDDAISAADGIWNLYLAGTASNRPFGQLVLDGVDVQSTGGTAHYPAFIQRLWGHMDNTAKKYYLTATVGCAYPDPSLGECWGQNGNLFDYIAIRYFNDYNCAGSAELVDFSFTKRWVPLAKSFAMSPPELMPIFPGSSKAVTTGYLSANATATLLEKLAKSGTLGGFGVWNSEGLSNVAVGELSWLQQILAFLKGGTPSRPSLEDCP